MIIIGACYEPMKSWALDRKAPIHAKAKIYTLSNAEHDFWTKMVDKTTGHIRNQLRSEDAESMARIGIAQKVFCMVLIITSQDS